MTRIGERVFLEKLYREVQEPSIRGRLVYKKSLIWQGATALEWSYNSKQTNR